jgi:hypothetical protein
MFIVKSVSVKLVNDAFWSLERACMRTGLNRELHDAVAIVTREERAHRRMGKRFTNGQCSYRVSADVAARLLVLQTLEKISLDMTAEQLCDLNGMWTAVAKLKFAMERKRVRLFGVPTTPNGYTETVEMWDTMGWYRLYYAKRIGRDVAPKWWDLMLQQLGAPTEAEVDAYRTVHGTARNPAEDARMVQLEKLPFMGVDYARDCAVR